MMNPMFYFPLVLTVVLAATAETLFDIDSNPISGGSYYLTPRNLDAEDGGLNLAPRGGNKCPLYIGLDDTTEGDDIPVRLSDWDSGWDYISETEPLHIEMDIKRTICSESTYWNITAPDEVLKTSFITAGPKPSNRLFQIQKGSSSGGYEIYFCRDDSGCTRVGIFVEKNGVRRFALNSTRYEFWFIKADSSKTMSIM